VRICYLQVKFNKAMASAENTVPAPLRTLIVEDDPVHLVLVRSFVEQLPMLQFMGAVQNVQEAERMLAEMPVDLLVLDIGLPGDSGYRLLERSPLLPAVIVTTGDPGHALEGFEHGVVDLLVKPFSKGRFLQAVHRVQHRLASFARAEALRTPPPPKPSVLLNSGRRTVSVFLEDILVVEAYGNHVKVHLRNERIVVKATMDGISLQLSALEFIRVHRRYIVGCHAVQSVEEGKVVTPVGEVPVGTSYRRAVLERLERCAQAA
jgi:DNA-binding LytR/AlgR family response regulator